MWRRLASLVLALTVVIGIASGEAAVSAASGPSSDDSGVSSWSTWNTCRWGIDPSGTLWIEPQDGGSGTGTLGTGAIPLTGRDESLDYDDHIKETATSIPWSSRSGDIVYIRTKGVIRLPSQSCGMFAGLSSLRGFDAAGFDTSGCTDMSYLFAGDFALESLNLRSWNVDSVMTLRYMLMEDFALKNVNLSGWKTSKVTDWSCVFNRTSNLSEITGVADLDTSAGEDFTGTFFGNHSLSTVDVSKWNVSNGTRFESMFASTSLVTLELSSWDTSKAQTFQTMFAASHDLESLGTEGRRIGNWKTGNVTTMEGMFRGCGSLSLAGYLSMWDTSKVTSMAHMFEGRTSSTSYGDIDSWNVSNVTDMTSMFSGCSNATRIVFYHWNPSKLEKADHLLEGCDSLTSIDFSGWDTSSVKSAGNMLAANGLRSITLGKKFGISSAGTGLPSSIGDAPAEWVRKGTNDTASSDSLMTLKSSNATTAGTRAGTWELRSSPKITYAANGGGAVTSSQEYVSRGGKASGSTAKTVPGYRFDGWYSGSTKLASDATYVPAAPDASPAVPTGANSKNSVTDLGNGVFSTKSDGAGHGGYGSGFALQRSKDIPYGKWFIATADVYSPVDAMFVADVNCFPTEGEIWSNSTNDNDDLTSRFGTGLETQGQAENNRKVSVKANTWTTVTFGYRNNRNANTNKVPVYDSSCFGLLAADGTPLPADTEVKIRNIEATVSDVKLEHAYAYTARYTPCQLKIIYHVNGGTPGGDCNADKKDQVEEIWKSDTSVPYGLSDPYHFTTGRDGYRQTDYYLIGAPDSNKKIYMNKTFATGYDLARELGYPIDTQDQTVHLYVEWEPVTHNEYKAYWLWGFRNSEGNNPKKTAFELADPKTLQAKTGEKVTIPPLDSDVAVPNGTYVKHVQFYSWKDGDQIIDSSIGGTFEHPTYDGTLEYDFHPRTYAITYNLNGGTNASSNPSEYNVLYGVTLADPTRPGYKFLGWTDSSGKKVTGINQGENATFSSREELYAKLAARTTGEQVLTANWQLDLGTLPTGLYHGHGIMAIIAIAVAASALAAAVRLSRRSRDRE